MDFVLDEKFTLIWQRDLVHDIDDISLNRYREARLRHLHPINLLQDLLESSPKTVMAQNADGLQSSDL